MISKEKMKEVILKEACEQAGEFAKQTAIAHMAHGFEKGLLDRYVGIANEHYKTFDEKKCLETSGFKLHESYKYLVRKGINSIDLNGSIVGGFKLVRKINGVTV